MQEPLAATTEFNLEEFREKLSSEFKKLDFRKIPGSRLAPLIDSVLPHGTNYRLFIQSNKPANLLAFVEKYLGGLVGATADKSGTDTIYDILATSSAYGEIQTHGMLWKSFAAVSPSRELFLDSSTSELNVRDLSAVASPGTPTIKSVTLKEFEEIRAEFLNMLEKNGDITPELKAFLASDFPVSYQVWISRLKLTGLKLASRWQDFRRDSILILFHSRLAALGVHIDRIEELKVRLQRDLEQTQTRKKDVLLSVESDTRTGTSAGPKNSKEKHARELLHAAVDRMSTEQMQSLNIPFSIVLELFNHLPK